MPADHEVTQAIPRIREGCDEAAQVVWQNYFSRLTSLAKKRLNGQVRRTVDEEDVALSAMFSFCRGLEAGKFDKLEDREELWKLLVTITDRKICSKYRRAGAKKRGGDLVRGESILLRVGHEEQGNGLAEVAISEPTPELAAEVVENCKSMLDCLDETSRDIALLSLEGYSQSEIAEKVGVLRETVNRKIRRIKDKWTRLGFSPSDD